MNDEPPSPPDHPVVLCHGFLGFDRMGIRGIREVHYFKEIKPFLEDLGCRVHEVRVARTQGIEVRARELKSQIKSFDRPVHLVAHSMGGLDARHLITHLEGYRNVVSLTTLGTPHRGTSFADWFSENRFRGKTLVKMLGINIDGLHQLTRPYLRNTFNPETPDHPDVTYFSYGGSASRDQLPHLLKPSFDIIMEQEGENDGLVPTQSAEWGTTFTELKADHLDLVNWSQSFDAFPVYAGIIDRAASLE